MFNKKGNFSWGIVHPFFQKNGHFQNSTAFWFSELRMSQVLEKQGSQGEK
jgi:hypothetical protein